MRAPSATDHSSRPRILKYLPFCAATLFAAFCFALQSGRTYRVDEIYFPQAAASWALHGGPLSGDGLWHTPFYLEALRVWQRIWGLADPALPSGRFLIRAFGLVCLIATSLLVAREAARRSRVAGWLGFAMVLLHPMMVQGSLLPDIDNTIQLPLMVMWCITVMRWEQKERGSWWDTIKIALLWAVLMMCKELTPLILLPLWLTYTLLRPLRQETLARVTHPLQCGFSIALGALFFALMLSGWSRFYHLPWDATLQLTFQKTQGRGPGYRPWNQWGLWRWIFLSYLPVLWLQWPALAWIGYLTPWKKILKNFPARIPLSFWIAVAILLAYTWIVQVAFYFPKYSVVVWPFLVMGALESCELEVWVDRTKIAYFLGFSFLLPQVRHLDPLLIIDQRRGFNSHFALFHVLAIALPLLWGSAALQKVRRPTKGAQAGWASLILLAYFCGTLLHHAIATESPGYVYGEQGFDRTWQAALALPSTQKILAAAGDLAFVLKDRARLVDFNNPFSNAQLREADVLVARNYDNYSPRYRPEWLARVVSAYPCHMEFPEVEPRFDLWWRSVDCTKTRPSP